MQNNNKIVFVPVLTVLTLLMAGCLDSSKPIDQMLPSQQPPQQNADVAGRFTQSSQQANSAVESAIQISEKYAKLSDEMVTIRKENQDLANENKQLKEKLTVLQPKLDQTQKELAQANDLLLEMRIELNNWKTNVLGFRDEMRGASTAQIEALYKILKVLGGETTADALQQTAVIAAAESANEPEKAQPK